MDLRTSDLSWSKRDQVSAMWLGEGVSDGPNCLKKDLTSDKGQIDQKVGQGEGNVQVTLPSWGLQLLYMFSYT